MGCRSQEIEDRARGLGELSLRVGIRLLVAANDLERVQAHAPIAVWGCPSTTCSMRSIAVTGLSETTVA